MAICCVRQDKLETRKGYSMAMKNGRCQNCGSIITVDDTKPEAVCMFCWAHTPSSEAIAIEQEPEAYEFPNEEQAEPSSEDRALAFHSSSAALVSERKSTPALKKQKSQKMTPAEKVAQQKKDLIEPKVSKKNKLLVLLSIVGFIAILTAIFLPTTLNRDAKRKDLVSRIHAIVPNYPLKDSAFAFEGGANQLLTIVLPEAIDDVKAKELMNSYQKERAEVYGISDPESQTFLKLRIYSMDKIYTINGKDEIRLSSDVTLPTTVTATAAPESSATTK